MKFCTKCENQTEHFETFEFGGTVPQVHTIECLKCGKKEANLKIKNEGRM